jgi:hypothetical protein
MRSRLVQAAKARHLDYPDIFPDGRSWLIDRRKVSQSVRSRNQRAGWLREKYQLVFVSEVDEVKIIKRTSGFFSSSTMTISS